eukprot:TRINITY_DN5455_c1_g1_i1.p1 TRINITY_DN5455_c1_g1~~TRINITY_DN5455_c1_g1_i1.p1  ORF type:complete len:217 (+),score=59.93 TRINITY_DN5455_c1_g1_i1:217-867(+)
MGISSSKKRWFTLQEVRLLYYSEEQEKFSFGKGNPPEGNIPLQFALSIEPSGKKGIKIIYPERIYELEASDSTIRDKWVSGLNTASHIYKKLEEHTGSESNIFGITKKDMEKEGVMDIKGMFGWKENHIMLRDGMLFVFSAKGGARKAKIPLYDCKLNSLPADKDRYAFELIAPETKQEIQLSMSGEDADVNIQMWLNAILKQKLMIEEAINLISF